MQQLLHYLKCCPREITKHFIQQNYAVGDTIIHQGDRAQFVYILLEGQAQVSSLTLEGLKHVECIYQSGGLFGEIEVLNNKPILSSIETLTPCQVIQIPSDLFKKWLLKDSHFSLYITTQLATKLYQSSIHSQTNIAYPLKYRILYFLEHYSDYSSSEGISKQLIVESVLSNIRSVNRVLKDLSDTGVITIKNRRVYLNSPTS